jgi:dihydrofolate reductase
MRNIIAALQTSVDCFIEGPNGEMDWAMAEDEETWKVMNETLNSVDALILGRRMYPGYEQYWLSLLANSSIEQRMKKHTHDVPIKYPILFSPRLWTK